MADQKIKVSLDEVNSTQVDAELHRQGVAQRMAEHQEKIRLNFGGSGEMLGAKGGFFRKAMVYMAVFSIVSSIFAWIVGERFISEQEKNPFYIARQVYAALLKEKPDASKTDLKRALSNIRSQFPEQKDNPYFQDSFLDKSEDEVQRIFEDANSELMAYNCAFYIFVAMIIAIGLSIAEACVSKNITAAVKNGVIAVVLGSIGGLIVSLFIDSLYNAFGGGVSDSINANQIFARAIAWGCIGLFVAIAPGIILKSWKKFLLGCIGGLVGGIIGGVLFDPICLVFKSVSMARFVNVVGLGVGAAVATVFLENIAKQGWLKVAAGVIAGKQFILYRNPTVIGSSPKCEIYLFKDPSIAPKHAAINNRNGDFLITAIEGATVLVNNSPVRQQKLKSGDQIKIGYTTFIFEAKALKKQ